MERNTRRILGIAENTAGGTGVITGGRLAHPVFFKRILELTMSTRRIIPIPKTSAFAILKEIPRIQRKDSNPDFL